MPTPTVQAVDAARSANGSSGETCAGRDRPSPAVTSGRATSINILTPTQPWWLPWFNQKFNLWLVRRPEWVVRNVVGKPPLPAQLKRLNFLYSATWSRVGNFPRVGSRHRFLRFRTGPRERHRWLLFCSNFTREWEPYLQSFLDVLADGIHTIWGDSIDFPSYPNPGSRYATVRWEHSRLIRSQHYYCAYPWATTNDVRAALRVRRELLAVAFQRRALRSAGQPDHVVVELAAFLARIQHCLVDVARRRRRRRSGRSAQPTPTGAATSSR